VRLIPTGTELHNNLGHFTPMCLCHQEVKLGTGRKMLMFFGWEDEGTPGGK